MIKIITFEGKFQSGLEIILELEINFQILPTVYDTFNL